jgi:hypothetical protein
MADSTGCLCLFFREAGEMEERKHITALLNSDYCESMTEELPSTEAAAKLTMCSLFMALKLVLFVQKELHCHRHFSVLTALW